ncbi:glycosyltransferase [Aestuariimicrobium sp. p3-SID1156]|uniref:glycosyltransferase n=1 Tax=Aestuariimicrobium sp. p3-SID1156 TaxID=2916038 RepID=UPI00223B1501|nr:glycosyltransferase [Aestuariimicrobium sp. p3-SID1156]MCT1458272.1 glycosyltransferase [Aestuariimicrobium sp. p3-SID1156]
MPRPRIAIAHDYLTQRGGAERVVLAMHRAFPEAPIYTTIYTPETTFPEFAEAKIFTSETLSRIRLLQRDHRLGLPLYPWGIDRTPTIDADVLLVSTTGYAHGFSTNGKKLVYCHSPARFLYLADEYLGKPTWRSPIGWALAAIRPALIRWDQQAAASADKYLANSTVIRQRIRHVYGIEAQVVPAPPALTSAAEGVRPTALSDWGPGYFLVVSRLLPYKNVSHVLDAFRELPTERLVVVGKGPLEAELRRQLPTNARMLQGISDAELSWVYQHASALVAPSFEDYGLTPLEAAAFGVPTIALGAGGYLDTVKEGISGLFFADPTPEAIATAVRESRGREWDPASIELHAQGFSESRFAEALGREVDTLFGQ